MPSYPINVTTVAGKGSPLNAVEFDSNLTTLKDAVNDLHDNKLDSSTYTASDILTKIKTVDGAGSGLDADMLDGNDSSFYRNASNINAGTLSNDRLSSQVYTKNNIVGTVSQSGGVPTGAIIERGSNANGNYIKFADGTMICTQVSDISGLNIPNGDYCDGLLPFPASFVGDTIYKSVSGFAYSFGYVNLCLAIDMVRLREEYSWRFRVKNTSDYVMAGVYVYLQAMGRWY